MPVETRWLIRGRVIFSQALGDVSRVNFDLFIADIDALMHERTGEIHFVQDLRMLTQPNSNFNNVRKLLRVMRGFDGWYLQFGQDENPVLRFLMSTSAKMLNIRTRPIYPDYASLRAFLAGYDPELALPVKPLLYFSDADLQAHLPQDMIDKIEREDET